MTAGAPVAPPPVSVTAVICAQDAAPTLGRTLESLCAQTLPPDAFEVVVVDDGSSGPTGEVVRSFEGRLRVRVARQRRAGLPSARNHGILRARGYVVLFLDDAAADPGLLEAHLEAHRHAPDPRYAVVGRARLDAPLEADPLMGYLHARGWPPFSPIDGAAGDDPVRLTDLVAGRSSWKRSFLLDFGFFDPTLEPGGEGPELAWRLAPRGLALVLEPDAAAVVAERVTVDDACARAERDGRAKALLARRHPDAAASWAGAADAAGAWRDAANAYPAIVRSARELDRIARMRLEAGLPIPERELALLHRGYAAALSASRAKGLIGDAP